MKKNEKKWYTYERESHYSLDKPSITVTANQIFFNSALVKKINMDEYQSIELKFDDLDLSKASEMRFIPNQDVEGSKSFKLRRPKANHAMRLNISCMPVIRQCPRLSKLQNNRKKSERRVFVNVNEEDKTFSLSLKPNFELKIKNLAKIESVSAIYKIYNNEEPIYIGQAKNLKSRISQHRQADKWIFDKIEYSILESEKDRLFWENEYLKDFEKEYGSLPMYNNNRGHKNVVPINY